MKLFQSIFIVLLFWGCQDSSKNDYLFESELYNCISDLYKNENIDLSQLISAFEQELIDQNLMKNNSGKNYLKYIDHILSSKKTTPPISSSLQKKFLKIKSPAINCLTALNNSPNKLDARMSQLKQLQETIMRKIINEGELDPFKIGKEVLSHLKEEDFEQPFYKVLLANTWFEGNANALSEDKGITTKLPPWGEDEPDFSKLDKRNVLSVLVNKKNELIVRDKKMDVNDLRVMVKEFIANPNQDAQYAEKPNKAIVSLKNERGTDYKAYLKVYNEIKGAYNELWDELAFQNYGKAFEELNYQEKKEIRTIIPLVISEAEPTAFGEEN